VKTSADYAADALDRSNDNVDGAETLLVQWMGADSDVQRAFGNLSSSWAFDEKRKRAREAIHKALRKRGLR
jgi:hypothetical protein